MAYQTGTASSVDDLLSKLDVFLAGVGWTINQSTSLVAGYYTLSVYHADAGYFTFQSNNTAIGSYYDSDALPRIYISSATGYSAGQTIGNQPNASSLAYSNRLFPPLQTYYFFATTEYIHVCVEESLGTFTHFGCGYLNKAWNFNGGQYCYGTAIRGIVGDINDADDQYRKYPFGTQSGNNTLSSYSSLRCDVDGTTNEVFTTQQATSLNTTSKQLFSTFPQTSDNRTLVSRGWYISSPNAFNGISVTCPIVLAISHYINSQYKKYIAGEVKDIRWINMYNYDPGQSITYGSDEWVVFPLFVKQKNSVATDVPSSSVYGIAYRKIT